MKIEQKRKSVSLSIKRKKNSFNLPDLIDDPLLENEIKDKFQRAFFSKGMKYTTKLVYDTPECSEHMNDPNLDNI